MEVVSGDTAAVEWGGEYGRRARENEKQQLPVM